MLATLSTQGRDWAPFLAVQHSFNCTTNVTCVGESYSGNRVLWESRERQNYTIVVGSYQSFVTEGDYQLELTVRTILRSMCSPRYPRSRKPTGSRLSHESRLLSSRKDGLERRRVWKLGVCNA